MTRIYDSADMLIGRTPLLRLSRLEKAFGAKAQIIAKLEMLNPAGSVKDRVAKNMIEDAEKRGVLQSGATIIEPTSGNTGIGLCSVAAVKGYKTIIVMPDTMSQERITMMQAYGAEVVLTEGAKGMAGAIEKAEELHELMPGSFIPGQFVNPANAEAHRLTTGPEIWEDTDGDIDIFIAGVGTGGTITGTGSYLKEKNPDIKIIAVEPEESPVLTQGYSGKHGIQGIGANFVPEVLDRNVLDDIFTVKTTDAFAVGGQLGKTEGILAGISAGAALYAAIELSKKKENEGKKIVVILPDSGDRYFSTSLFI